jgi:hypothetical protein
MRVKFMTDSSNERNFSGRDICGKSADQQVPRDVQMTTKMHLIVTHTGSAHFDEVTAISLILATHPETAFRTERRLPEQAELDDHNVWVVDTGRRLEPERLNFDHHQNSNLAASFVLVAGHLGLAETLSIMPWWHFKDSVDRIGARRSSAIFGAGDDLVNRNPMEEWLVDRFASDPESTLPLLRTFGLHLIEDARDLKKQIEFWKSSRRLVIAGVAAAVGETRETAGLEEFRRVDERPPDIIISLDSSGEGWRLFRYEGAPVDFSRISDRPEIAFAHNSGFMAKTKERLALDELTALVSKAVMHV